MNATPRKVDMSLPVMVNWGGHRVALYDACEAEGLFQQENGLNGLGLRTSAQCFHAQRRMSNAH
jgi:hypothetical protein